MSSVIEDHHHDDHHHGPAKGIMRWVFTTNHKDIGTLYLWFSFMMFLLGGSFALVIRAELFQPGLQIVEPEFFNQMTTMHGLIMVFGAVMPAFVGLANWLVPMMIGAPDMALPRMNNWSFWILPFAFAMLLSTLFMPGGAPAGGWTMYPPLVLQGGHNVGFLVFSVHMMGISSIMGAINVIATIMNMRAPNVGYLNMPLFVWTWLITAFLLIAVMPVLAGAVTMLLTDRYFDTSFFNAAGGGGAEALNDLSDAVTNSSGVTIGIGTNALANDDGSTNFNTALGYKAGEDITSGTGGVFVGYEAGLQAVSYTHLTLPTIYSV